MRTMWIAGLALAGCTLDDGDEALVGCLDDEVEPIADASLAVDGFELTPDEAAAALGGAVTGTLVLEDDTERALSLDLGTLVFTELARRSWQAPDDGSGIEPALDADTDCPDVYRAEDVAITLAASPELDEAWTSTVLFSSEGEGSFSGQVAYEELVGDAEPFGFDPATLQNVALDVYALHDGERWRGDLAFLGESLPTGTGGDDEVVSATRDPWGTFTAPDEADAE